MFKQSADHLKTAGKTYADHGGFALRAGFLLLWAGIASILHGIIPAIFPFVSHDIVTSLADQARARDTRNRPSSPQ